MALITLRDITIHFGDAPLLDRVNLTIEAGERSAVVGRNGAGKSTLLNIIGGRRAPDSGEVIRSRGLTVGTLAQEVPGQLDGSVVEVICRQLGAMGGHLADYRRLCERQAAGIADADDREQFQRLQQTIDTGDGWVLQQQVEQTATRMNLPLDAKVADFSAGMKRQVMLAAALAARPQVLLLDEPTNHLDMPAVDWLEKFLLAWNGTLLLISHDRMLVSRLADRILEVDRGDILSWKGDYRTYLQRSQARLDAEEKQHDRLDKRLSAEEAWLRQGIKARRTRNEGRVRALEKLREERRRRRDRTGRPRMALTSAERSGKVVVEASDLTFAYGTTPIVEGLSCTIMRGDRIGIMGPNGAGKSTLVRLLLGELAPQKGRIRHGTNLRIRYFDQLRAQLDENRTVQENIAPDGDMLDVGDRRCHVIGYLKDFLFSPQRARTPVWVLSGGEKNRLLLAKLFSRPANVLVLDEPTNDLDVETLELLEERLAEFTGTVLLVSHDRAFINNVVTSTLVFEAAGKIEGYAGGYDDWLSQRPAAPTAEVEKPAASPPRRTPPPQAKKRGYLQQRELDALPGRIEALEQRQQELFQAMSDPQFYRRDGAHIASVKQELARVEADLEAAFARWEALESDQP